jgi:3-oxoacyl-[acyl-carrier-protein] synthase II
MDRSVWITGVGLLSCLGDSEEAHSLELGSRAPGLNVTEWAPYACYPFGPFAFDAQIPKKSDQRQMAQCQRIGTYAAGRALAAAGLKDQPELLAKIELIAATTGGERDIAIDSTILSGVPKAANPDEFINQTLTEGLRPTFFLGQLPNLLAGNIAIVHGVTGSARTFLGEETAGVDAVRTGMMQVASGQSDIALVGGACNGSRKDILLYIVAAGQALKADVASVFDRAAAGGGVALGSIGAFLVLESEEHARKRGAKPLARLAHVASDVGGRGDAARAGSIAKVWEGIAPALRREEAAVLSGATGAEPVTGIERSFLAQHRDIPLRVTGTYTGHGIQAQFPMNIAIAALSLRQGALPPASGAHETERTPGKPLTQVVVSGLGRKYGEGIALVEAVA